MIIVSVKVLKGQKNISISTYNDDIVKSVIPFDSCKYFGLKFTCSFARIDKIIMCYAKRSVNKVVICTTCTTSKCCNLVLLDTNSRVSFAFLFGLERMKTFSNPLSLQRVFHVRSDVPILLKNKINDFTGTGMMFWYLNKVDDLYIPASEAF
jgi:hypothetical protein